MSVLRLDDVHKSRGSGRRQVHVLRGASLAVDAGEIVLLEGPSGSGKTTLLTIAAGLLTADRGHVELAGALLAQMSAEQRREHRAANVGFVFQRANLLQGLTAEENVLFAAELAAVPADEARRRSAALFVELGIDGLEDRMPNQLSGGEEHRVAIARAVVHRPALVLADEPTGNLDSSSGHAVMLLLEKLVREQGVALVIATHDVRLRELPASILSMTDGHVADSEQGAA